MTSMPVESNETARRYTADSTLTEYPEIEQGTDEWHDQRRGIVTASVVGQLLTANTKQPAVNDSSRGLTLTLLAERITGRTEPSYMNDDMMRGVENEPRARDLYSETYAPVRETGFMVRTGIDWRLGYSPDGLVGDDGLIEVKSPRAKTHIKTILADEVPPQYMAQCQAGLLVSGREWLDFISYSGGLPMWHKRVLPDERWHEAIVEAVRAFEKNAAEMFDIYGIAVLGFPETEYIEEEAMVL